MRSFLLCLLGVMLLWCSGCSSKLGDFTVLSSKNVNLADFSTYSGTGGDRIVGEDVKTCILLFWNKPEIQPKEAVDDALNQANAYMLTDATLKSEGFWALLLAQDKYVAEGHPVRR